MISIKRTHLRFNYSFFLCALSFTLMSQMLAYGQTSPDPEPAPVKAEDTAVAKPESDTAKSVSADEPEAKSPVTTDSSETSKSEDKSSPSEDKAPPQEEAAKEGKVFEIEAIEQDPSDPTDTITPEPTPTTEEGKEKSGGNPVCISCQSQKGCF